MYKEMSVSASRQPLAFTDQPSHPFDQTSYFIKPLLPKLRIVKIDA